MKLNELWYSNIRKESLLLIAMRCNAIVFPGFVSDETVRWDRRDHLNLNTKPNKYSSIVNFFDLFSYFTRVLVTHLHVSVYFCPLRRSICPRMSPGACNIRCTRVESFSGKKFSIESSILRWSRMLWSFVFDSSSDHWNKSSLLNDFLVKTWPFVVWTFWGIESFFSSDRALCDFDVLRTV